MSLSAVLNVLSCQVEMASEETLTDEQQELVECIFRVDQLVCPNRLIARA